MKKTEKTRKKNKKRKYEHKKLKEKKEMKKSQVVLYNSIRGKPLLRRSQQKVSKKKQKNYKTN